MLLIGYINSGRTKEEDDNKILECAKAGNINYLKSFIIVSSSLQ